MKVKINLRKLLKEYGNSIVLVPVNGAPSDELIDPQEIPDEVEVEIDLQAALADTKQIAAVWGFDDVQDVRADLNDEQAWQVLRHVERHHDCNYGITWDHLREGADDLFPKKTTDAG